MLGTSVDIENELTDIASEVSMLLQGLDIFRAERAASEAAKVWLGIQGLASAVEKIYSGCERVMAIIANEVDGAKVERGDGWHVSLLKRMSHPFGDAREPVISTETYLMLDRLRSFRHRERNTYGLVLDADIVVERAGQTALAFDAFRKDVRAFFAKRG